MDTEVIVSLDDDYWTTLARKFKLRLPQHATPLTTGQMERWLKKLGISNKAYREWSGNQSSKAFIAANPTCNLRRWVGIMLEYADEYKTLKETS